jgi:hypothetical protein
VKGAKDVKFGPLDLVPDKAAFDGAAGQQRRAADFGFAGGVISSVGPFYGSCPCGWDFSFYHILIEAGIPYYAEVVSFPEQFTLRFWSPNDEDAVLLNFFYPSSLDLDVFMGSAAKNQALLKLANPPSFDDDHGSMAINAQTQRFQVVLRGSLSGFRAMMDMRYVTIPAVKLKMNVKISLEEFNGDNFATNLATLLGIPPERIKVVAVGGRRLEESVGATERRLAAATALDITILPSEAAAVGAGGGSGASTSASISAQSSELKSVSDSVTTLSSAGTELAAAAGGEVVVEEIVPPAEAETNTDEVEASQADVEVAVVD